MHAVATFPLNTLWEEAQAQRPVRGIGGCMGNVPWLLNLRENNTAKAELLACANSENGKAADAHG